MVQLGRFLPLLGVTLATAFKARAEIAKHKEPLLAKNAAKYFGNKGINKLNKKCTSEGLGITVLTVTNNEIGAITKVIKSQENRGILWKETTEKVLNQKVGFLGLLKITGLSLMKYAKEDSLVRYINCFTIN